MRLLSLFLFSLSSLFAVPYTVTASGAFLSSIPVTTFTAPNQTWSFRFLIDSNPVPTAFSSNETDLPISGFEYRLNGTLLVNNISRVRFYDNITSSGGFLTLGVLPISFPGPQLFSGTTASPTILPGVYTFNQLSRINGQNLNLAPQVTIAAAIPEPASVGLSLIGLVGLGLLRRRARR